MSDLVTRARFKSYDKNVLFASVNRTVKMKKDLFGNIIIDVHEMFMEAVTNFLSVSPI